MINSEYIIGDSKDLKEIFDKDKLPAPSLIISSPPYFDVLNYENNENQIGHKSIDYSTYLNEVTQIYQDCYDISTDNSSLWIIIDTFKRQGSITLLPFDIVNNLNARCNRTWLLKEVIIWDKEKNLPWNAKGRFKNQFEYILYFTKSENFNFKIDELRDILDLKKWWKTYPERYNTNGKAPTNIWSFTTPIRGWGNSLQNHLCPLPYPLAERIITLSSEAGDVIFDPFAGSGTLLALSSLMGRRSIGIDINSAYKDLFDTEVIVGAKRYWNNRVRELELNKDLLINFKTLLIKLRKQKLAYLLHLVIIKAYPELQFSILVEDGTNNNVKYKISNQNIELESVLNDDSIKDYLKQSKVKAAVTIEDFFIANANAELFRYTYKKFYKYNGRILNNQMLNLKPDNFFSTIDILINE